MKRSSRTGGANPASSSISSSGAAVAPTFNNTPQVEELRQQLLSTLTPDQRKRLAFLSNVTNTEKYEGQVDLQSRRHGKGILKWSNGNCYFGGWIEGSMSGLGTFLYGLEEDAYTGEFHDDKKHGRGRYVFANGNSYEGEFLLDKRHGKGIYSWTCGDCYDGEWHDGRMHGFGVTIYANGNRYEGSFVEDRREGEGKLMCTDGLSYAGSWLKNMRHGVGTLTFPSKDFYHGEWLNDKKHGKGRDVFVNGNEFDGTYVENEKCGVGTMKYANGDRYEGEWKGDKMHGSGNYKFSNGFEYCGEWSADTRHGRGVYTFPNGHVYDGQWKSDKRHGSGTLTLAATTSPHFAAGAAPYSDRYVGTWNDGKMSGAFQVLRVPSRSPSSQQSALSEEEAFKVYEGKWDAGMPAAEGRYFFRHIDLYPEEERDAGTREYIFSGKWNTANAAKKSDGTVEFPNMLAECLFLAAPHCADNDEREGARDALLRALVPVSPGDAGVLDGHFAAAMTTTAPTGIDKLLPPELLAVFGSSAISRAKKATQHNAQVLVEQTELLREAIVRSSTESAAATRPANTATDVARAHAEARDAAAALLHAREEHEALQHRVLDEQRGTSGSRDALSEEIHRLNGELAALKKKRGQIEKENDAVAGLKKAKAEAEKEVELQRAKLAEAREQLEKVTMQQDGGGDAAVDGDESAVAAKMRLTKECADLRTVAAQQDAELQAVQKQLNAQGSEYRARIKRLEDERAKHECAMRDLEKKTERARLENERLRVECGKAADAAQQKQRKTEQECVAHRDANDNLIKQLRETQSDVERRRAELSSLVDGDDSIKAVAHARRGQLCEHVRLAESDAMKSRLRCDLVSEELVALREQLSAAQLAKEEQHAAEERHEEGLRALQRQMDREVIALQDELATQEDALRVVKVEAEHAEAEAADAVHKTAEAAAKGDSPAPQGVVVGRIRRRTSSLLSKHDSGGSLEASSSSSTMALFPGSSGAVEDDANSPDVSNDGAEAKGVAAEVRRRMVALDAQQHEHEVAIAQLQRRKTQLDEELEAAKAAKKGAKRQRSKAKGSEPSGVDDDDNSFSLTPSSGFDLRKEAGREALENQLRKARSVGDAILRERQKLEERIDETRGAIAEMRSELGGGKDGVGSGSGTIQRIIANIGKDDWRLKYLADQIGERGRVLAQLERECTCVGQLEEQLAQMTLAIGALQSHEAKLRMDTRRPSSSSFRR